METYDPSNISVIVGGEALSGFADGSFVNAERNEDAFAFVPSSTGRGTRTKNANRSGRITLTLQKTSPSNKILNDLANADEQTNDGIFSILIRDNGGSDLHKGETSWILKKPAAEEAKELPNREWVIECEELLMNSTGAA